MKLGRLRNQLIQFFYFISSFTYMYHFSKGIEFHVCILVQLLWNRLLLGKRRIAVPLSYSRKHLVAEVFHYL